jgi:PAS domain S-box-containing protein
MKSAIDLLPTLVLDSLTSGILAVDSEFRVVQVNAKLSQLFGINTELWIGKPAEEMFSSVETQVPARRLPLYRSRPKDNTRTHSREVEWSDGQRTLHLREDSGPLRDDSGNSIGRLYAYHDLSWEKTIDQMKSEFISIASHELRTPMTSIKGSVDLILGGAAGEVSADALELLEVAHSSCDRMIRLINDILDLSKIEAGQIRLKLAPIELTDPAELSIRSLKSLAAKDRITLSLEAPQQLPLVHADKDRMEQVMSNLIFNAIKYSPPGGEVKIALCAENGWVRCTVADQGCGVPEEDLHRIFGRFQQAGSPQRGGGTGLGLAISHALVTEHKGKIWAESRMGEGSRFIFCLPVAPALPAA